MKVDMLQRVFPRKIPFIRYLITVSMVVVSVFLLSIGLIFYTLTFKYIGDKLELMESNKYYQLYSDIDETIHSVDRVIEYLQNSDILQNYLDIAEAKNIDSFKRGTAINNIFRFITNAKEYSVFMKQIFIITQNNEYSNYSTQMFNFNTLRKIRDLPDEKFENIVFLNYGIDNSTGIELKGTPLLDEYPVFAARLRKDNKFNGKIFIILDESYLANIRKMMGTFYIVDESGNLIWPNMSSLSNAELVVIETIKNRYSEKEGEFSLKGIKPEVVAKRLSGHNWMLVYSIDNKIIAKQKNNIILYIFATLLLSTILAYIFSKLISVQTLKPIKKLTGLIDSYDGKKELGKFDCIETKGKSMRDSLILYFVISIVIPILVFVVIFSVTSTKYIETYTIGYYNASFDKISDRIDKYVERKLKALQRIVYNISVQQNTAKRENRSLKQNDMFNIITENSVLGQERDIINIYNNTGNLMYTNYYAGAPDFNEEFSKKISAIKTGVTYATQRDKYNRYFINIGMPIFSQENKTYQGYIKQDIDNADMLQLYFELIGNSSVIQIVDNEGMIISSPKVDIIGKYPATDSTRPVKRLNGMAAKDGNKLMFSRKILYLPWHLVCEIDYYIIAGNNREFLLNNILIFIVVVLFVIVIAFTISNEAMKPLGKLNMFLFEFDPFNHERTKEAENYFIDEISILGRSFNKMADRIEELIDDLIVSGIIRNKLEGEKKAAEITALQAQINPHFLYNTLDMINYLAKQSKTDDVIMLINSLSDLFRFGISREEILITIDEEIKYTKAYSNIINLIYGGKIEFIWKVDDKIINCMTIKLILQPIVENAIFHGLKKKEGKIRIACYGHENYVVFEISDNGIGIANQEIKKIRGNLEDGTCKKIGLYNVYSRLKLNFGDNVEFSISSNIENGTTVKISIPKMLFDIYLSPQFNTF